MPNSMHTYTCKVHIPEMSIKERIEVKISKDSTQHKRSKVSKREGF